MKFSHTWLQKYFTEELPPADVLADKITFHSSEIEEVTSLENDTVLDVKVLPDKSAWLLSHRGLAKELSVILKQSLLNDPLKEEVNLDQTEQIKIHKNSDTCDYYSALLIKGVEVKESPVWLKEKLEALGQRSINNIVDATNYVMFDLGQPTHVFDVDKLGQDNGVVSVGVRQALDGEVVTTLSEEEIELSCDDAVIFDVATNKAIGIAGVKGGNLAAVDNSTKNILLESAHFNRVAVRKTAKRLKLQTDAAKRFENGINAQVAPIALRKLAKLITEIAGGEVMGENYSGEITNQVRNITCSLAKINSVLNLKLSIEEVSDILDNFGFQYKVAGETFEVRPTFERDDLVLLEDLIEDIGRMYGLDHIEVVMPKIISLDEYNARFYYSEKIRNILVDLGFSEIYTSSFRNKDEVKLANALASDKGYLRSTLVNNLTEARTANVPHRDLLGLKAVKLFEIGTVFSKTSEEVVVALAVQTGTTYKTKVDEPLLEEAISLIGKELGIELRFEYNKDGVAQFSLDKILSVLPEVVAYEKTGEMPVNSYKAFSVYPAISRDIAMWVTGVVEVSQIEKILKEAVSDLCVRITHLDTFTKDGRTSYAFRLVFQSLEKTLTDSEVQLDMDSAYKEVTKQGWEAR